MRSAARLVCLIGAAACTSAGDDHRAPARVEPKPPAESPDPAVVIDRDLMRPVGLAVNRSHVYWCVMGTGEVKRAPVAGGPIEPVATDKMMLSSCAVDDAFVYWASGNGIMKRRKDGGEPLTLVGYPYSWTSGDLVAADGTDVYWLDRGVSRVPRDDGPEKGIGLAGKEATSVALDASHIYWTAERLDVVMRLPKAGGEQTRFAGDESFADDIALSETHVYWTSIGRLRRAPKAGGPPETLFEAGNGSLRGVAVNRDSVYTTVHPYPGDPARIARIPLRGGKAVEARAGLWEAGAEKVYLAVDDHWLFVALDGVKMGGGTVTVAAPGYTGELPPPTGPDPVFRGAVFKIPRDFAARP